MNNALNNWAWIYAGMKYHTLYIEFSQRFCYIDILFVWLDLPEKKQMTQKDQKRNTIWNHREDTEDFINEEDENIYLIFIF